MLVPAAKNVMPMMESGILSVCPMTVTYVVRRKDDENDER